MGIGINGAWLPPERNKQASTGRGFGARAGSIPDSPCLNDGVGGLLMSSGVKFTWENEQEGMQ